MTRRDLVVVGLLTFFTCGIYALIWQYKTTDELKAVTRRDLNPGLEVLLTLVTCGLFGIYAHYRNAQLVTEQMKAWRGAHEDKSTLVLVLDLASLVVGVTWVAAVLVLQDELNKLAEAVPASGVMTVDPQRVG
ncbi:MAG: DUF4234 domain-containing protein [Myxococcus sp.]|nr:DUF4234 domain-containing protein [Myxococcus sp.]